MSQRDTEQPAQGRNWRRRTPLWVLAFTVIAATAVSPAAGRESSTAARFTPDEPLTSYRAFRRMHAKSEKFNQEGWLNAWTEFDGRQFRYQIVDERGSDYIAAEADDDPAAGVRPYDAPIGLFPGVERTSQAGSGT